MNLPVWFGFFSLVGITDQTRDSLKKYILVHDQANCGGVVSFCGKRLNSTAKVGLNSHDAECCDPQSCQGRDLLSNP